MNHELMQETVRQLERRIDWWRESGEDPHSVANTTIVALCEVASAMRDAMKKDYENMERPEAKEWK